MRALAYRGPGVVELVDVADPIPRPGEVIVAVTAAGVCGTDHHLVAGELGVAEGTIPGHEIAGRVVALGAGVTGWAEGDEVVSYGQVVCGECAACRSGHENRCTRAVGIGMARPGGFADYVALAARGLVARPAGVDPAVAAIATDAIATPYHALRAIGALEAGETVAVIGAGGLGLHAVGLARLLGAARIVAVDPSAEARTRAEAAGADDAFDPSAHDQPARALRELTGGVDAAFEFVGRASSVELGLGALRPGGRLVVVGIGHDRPRLPPVVRFVGTELAVRGSFGSTRAEIAAVVDLVASGRLDTSRSVSRRVGLADAPAVLRAEPGPARTVIEPGRAATTTAGG